MIKILCIDDEAAIRSLLVEEFHEAGLETLEASNGREGLEVIIREWPDIVVCDLSMPVMTGHELLAELRMNHAEFSNMPFIMLTAMTDRENTLAGLQAGADDYLTKPVDLELLMAKVSGCIMRMQRARAGGYAF
jgi:DNA-binding response OmpR family regulator